MRAANFYNNIFQALLNAPPEKTLIHWHNRDVNGKEILSHVASFRIQLTELKVRNGDFVLIASTFNLNTLYAILAIIAHGAVPVLPPAKPTFLGVIKLLSKKSNRFISLAREPNLISNLVLTILQIKPIVLSHHATISISFDKIMPPSDVPPNQPALITHSSGSTGKPKTISRSHAVLSAQHSILKVIFPPTPLQRDFPLFPAILLHNLACGVTTVVPDIPAFDILKVDIEGILNQLKTHSITSLTGNVYYFKKMLLMLRGNNEKFDSVLAVGIGGSPVPEYLLHDLKQNFHFATIYCIYGSSEAEPITVRTVSKWELPEKGFCVGHVAPGVELKIDTSKKMNQGKTLNDTGEIMVRGKHVVVPKNEDWYRTGDYGYVDDNNILYLTGRRGNEKIIHGVQHFQIENLLLNMRGVENAAAIARKDFFEIHLITNNAEQAIRNEISKYFSADCIGSIHFRSSLPVDNRHHSKIIYSQVK